MSGKIRFISQEMQSAYDAKGFTMTSLLGADQIQNLRDVFAKYFDLADLPSVYDTIAFSTPEIISAVNAEINDICAEHLSKVISGYRIACSIFFIKKPGDDSRLALHVDTSLTSADHTALGIWIPLCDIDQSVGRFCILENSEHFLPPYNTPSIPCSYGDVEHLLEPYLTCFSMKAGEALIMNNSTLHCTQQNTSDTTRLAAVIKVVDESAPLVTTYYDAAADEGKKVSLYKQTDDFFATGAFRSAQPPAHAEFVGYVPTLPKVFNAQEIAEILKNAPAHMPQSA